MKNTIKNTRKSILMVALLTASLSYANNNTPLKEKKESVKKTIIVLNNVKQGHELQIKDSYGLTLYTEIIERNGLYSKGFDLTELPDGNYLFELDKDLEIKIIPFTVKSNTVVFNEALETTVFKPYIKTVDGKIYLSKLALDEEPTHIDIYFENSKWSSELIYSETINDTKRIERVFDVSAIKGTYKVVLKTHEREFKNLINI